MKIFLIFFAFIEVLSCSYSSEKHSSTNNTVKTYNDPNKLKYNKILNGLKQDYVLYYRNLKSIYGDDTISGMTFTDSAFRLDSVKYSDSYRDFFNQDGDFINWLLSFKYDTTKSRLWGMSLNPISSHVSECNLWDLSNSRAAIILLENFLTGDGFECFECEYDNRQKCNLEKYVEIENFLNTNKKKNIIELRNAWREKSDR